VTVNEGATANQTLTATDPDGNALTFSKVSGPLFMTVTTTIPGTGTATGNVHLAPGFSDGGTYPAIVRVSDGSSTDSKSFTITVNEGVNRCPTANPGGPYTAIQGVPITFDGAASSDPDGDPLIYAWDFGDGSSGVGPTPVHTYVAGGLFTITLTVTDPGGCSHTATTTAVVLQSCASVVFNAYDEIRLSSGRPTWFAFVQPANGCYANTDVLLSSFVLKYAGSQIPAEGRRTFVGGDKSGDGIEEIRVTFAKSDLRNLFAGLPSGHNLVEVTVEANLVTGGILHGTTQVDVVSRGSSTVATVAPNPFNPSGTLAFTTSRPGPVKVEMFDIAGRMVRTILDERSWSAGLHEVRIDGRGQRGEALASGIYFIRGVTADGEFRRAIAILK
jgi:PKD repeat protein